MTVFTDFKRQKIDVVIKYICKICYCSNKYCWPVFASTLFRSGLIVVYFFGRCFSSFVRRTTKYLFFMCTTTQQWFVYGGLESNGLLVGSVSCISLCWWEWEGNVSVIHLWTFHKVALLVHCFQVELEFEMLVLWREENWRNQSRVNPLSKDENKLQTQPTCGTRGLFLKHTGNVRPVKLLCFHSRWQFQKFWKLYKKKINIS